MALWTPFSHRKSAAKQAVPVTKMSRSGSDISVKAGAMKVPESPKTTSMPEKPQPDSPIAPRSAPRSMLLDSPTRPSVQALGSDKSKVSPKTPERPEKTAAEPATSPEMCKFEPGSCLDVYGIHASGVDSVPADSVAADLSGAGLSGIDSGAASSDIDPSILSCIEVSGLDLSGLGLECAGIAPTSCGAKWKKLSSKPIFDGANGTIFKGSDVANTKFVVIKSVRKQPQQSYQNYALSVQREYDNLRKCAASKNVVEVYDLVAESDSPEPELSLIIKYFQYGDLLDYLCDVRTRKIPIPTHLKDAVFKQIVKAVDFLHRHDIVHRDIKPENFLIDVNGEIKLNDFGYSVDLSKVEEQLPLNEDCCGTPSFKAPELYRVENEKKQGSSDPEQEKEPEDPERAERKKKIARLEKMLKPEKSDKSVSVEDLDFKSVDVWALGIVCFQVYLMSVPWQTSSIYEEKNKKMEAYMENYPEDINQLRSLVDKLNDKNYSVALNPALTLFKKIHYDARIELLQMLNPNPNKRLSCADLLQSSWLTQAYAKPRDLLDLRAKKA